MQEGDSLSLGTQSGRLVNETDAGLATAVQRVVQVVHGEADVMDSGPAPCDEARDWRFGRLGLQQFDQWFTGGQSHDSCSVGVIQWQLRHAEDVTVEREDGFQVGDGQPDVGKPGAPSRAGVCGVG